jgi:hypothetical protein
MPSGPFLTFGPFRLDPASGVPGSGLRFADLGVLPAGLLPRDLPLLAVVRS